MGLDGVMVELFDSSKSNISEHITNIFEEKELRENSTVRKFRTVQNEGDRQVSRDIAYYNLDVIISVGYRVRSLRGTQFRIWATARLKEYIIKGFTMNDDLLKNGSKNNYFEELLARIRDIRSSELVFYRKVLDIFSTSIDYNAPSDDFTYEALYSVTYKTTEKYMGIYLADTMYGLELRHSEPSDTQEGVVFVEHKGDNFLSTD